MPFDCCQSLEDERSLIRLKSTNHELKHLIKKLENLSDTVDINLNNREHLLHHQYHNNYLLQEQEALNPACYNIHEQHHCHIQKPIEYHHNRRNSNDFKALSCLSSSNFICDSCDHINYLQELESIKKDPNIYPLNKYPRENKASECYECACNISCCRSRSRSRSSNSSSRQRRRSLSTSNSFLKNDFSQEIKPKWNGGPFKSSYLWRDQKLSGSTV